MPNAALDGDSEMKNALASRRTVQARSFRRELPSVSNKGAHGKPRFFACIGTLNLQVVSRHRQGAAGILSAVLFSDWSAGKMPAALWGSWRASIRFCACIGTLNLELKQRHREGAAGILPAVLFSDRSAGKMPAALWGSWRETAKWRMVAETPH